MFMLILTCYCFLHLAIILIINKQRKKLLNSTNFDSLRDSLNVKLHPVVEWLIYIGLFFMGGIFELIIVYYLFHPIPKNKAGEYDYKNGQLVFTDKQEDTNQPNT